MSKLLLLTLALIIISCGDTFKINKNSGATNQQINQEIVFDPQTLSTDDATTLSSICTALQTKMLYKLNDYNDSEFNFFVRAQECDQSEQIGNFIKEISDSAYSFTGRDNGLGLATYTGMSMMEQSKDHGALAIFCEYSERSMISTSTTTFKSVTFPSCPMENALCYQVITGTKGPDGKYRQSKIEQIAISTLNATKGFVKERRIDGSCTNTGSYAISEKLNSIVKEDGSTVTP